jgi:hypothetical protein
MTQAMLGKSGTSHIQTKTSVKDSCGAQCVHQRQTTNNYQISEIEPFDRGEHTLSRRWCHHSSSECFCDAAHLART